MIPRLTIKKIMSPRLVTIDYQKDLKTAAKQMACESVGSLVVTKDDEVVGIITETDIIRRVLVRDIDLTTIQVEEVMSYPVYSIDEDESLDKAHEVMGEHHVRHLLVTREGKPSGMISVRNILDSVYEWTLRMKP
jgi:signal-transduction protein with cAMP-binding, CBS, and nucleotidyltransferase domain